MPFILSANRKTPDEAAEAFVRYRRYLESVSSAFPPSALKLATSDWYFSNDPRSPHDSWLESVEILEQAQGERRESRSTQIRITLLGAYHEAYIMLFYKRVFNYDFRTQSPAGVSSGMSLGDWLWDEYTLNGVNRLVHEIEWQHGRWLIEADDVEYFRKAIEI